MATYINNSAGGNWSSGSMWCNVETGTNALQINRSASTTSTTSYVYTPAFTITALDVVDGIMLFIGSSQGAGTFTVDLEDGIGNVLGSVTVNVTDITATAAAGGWIFFKFGSSYTSTGLSTYKVGIKSSTSATVTVFRSATASDWSKILRLTTNASPTTSDNLFITGEWTAAATNNPVTVTMNNTASTQWGKVDVCSKGLLNWGTSASTAYLLKTGGTLEIWDRSEMRMGNVTTPVPTGSSAELSFVNSVNVDQGLEVRSGGILTTYGFAKTLKAKLLGTTNTITNKARTTTTVTITTSGAHGLSTNDNVEIQMTTPDPLLDGTYVVTGTTSTTFTYTTSSSGTIASQSASGIVTKNVKATATAGTLDQTPTGWKNGDTVVMASTSQTVGDTQQLTLSGDVSSSAFTCGSITVAHVAASPYQAEVINVTQNIKIHGTSSSLQAYVNVNVNGSVNCFYTEFYFLGSATTNKLGLTFLNSNATYSSYLGYCSFHDFTVAGSIEVTTPSVAFTMDNCVVYHISTGGNAVTIAGSGVISVTNNCFVATATGASVMVTCSSTGTTTITGNTAVGGSGSGFNLGLWPTTFSGNSAHSCGSRGLLISVTSAVSGTILNFTCWRCSGQGILHNSSAVVDTIYDSCTLFQNASGFSINGDEISGLILKSCSIYGGVQFVQTSGISLGSGGLTHVTFNTCTFGSPYANNADVQVGSQYQVCDRVNFNNCLFNSATDVNLILGLSPYSAIGFMNYNQVAGDHRAYKTYGKLKLDTVIYDVSPSERLTPNTASFYLESSSKFATVSSGVTRTISCKVRQSVVGDGTAYNGSFARLVAKYNPAIGITADTVIATADSGANGAFETLSGTTPSPTADGQMEFVVQVSATTGWVNVDSWAVV